MSQQLALTDESPPLIRPRDPCEGVGILREPILAAGDDGDDTNSQSHRLYSILSWKRPFDSAAEEIFARTYIDTAHHAVTKDAFANRHLHIPYEDGAPCKVIWSSHIDTCHHDEGYQRLSLTKDKDGLVFVGVRRGEGSCLGADDGTGVWLMLEMIRKGRPGYYLFHRGEERGCLGSRWLKDNKPDFLRTFEAAIALDRKGFDNIITHQGGQRGCSEEFAAGIAKAIPSYKADPTGMLTDTKQYFDLIPECTNLSVGYEDQHGPKERQYLTFALQLRKALLGVDLQALPIKRDPKRVEYRHTANYGGGYDWKDRQSRQDWMNENPFAEAHDPLGQVEGKDRTRKTHVWSRKERQNLTLAESVWIKGQGFVSRVNASESEKSAHDDNPVFKVKAESKPNIIGPPKPEDFDGEEALFPPEEELSEQANMEEDSGKSILELVEEYPDVIAVMMHEYGFKPFDILAEVYGEAEYSDFLNGLDRNEEIPGADRNGGISDADKAHWD